MKSLRCSCVSCDPAALLASPTELLACESFDVSSVHALCLRVRSLEEQVASQASEGQREIEECRELLEAARSRFEMLEELGKAKG